MKKSGSLPSFDHEPTSIELAVAYNYYFENYSWADAKNFLVAYLDKNGRKEEAKNFKKVPEQDISPVAGWIASMVMNGNPLGERQFKYLEEKGIRIPLSTLIKETPHEPQDCQISTPAFACSECRACWK